jgi:hypothetical protein
VPGDLAAATGGYAYDRRIIAELQQLGWQIDVVDLGDGFPWPSEQTRRSVPARQAGTALAKTTEWLNRRICFEIRVST